MISYREQLTNIGYELNSSVSYRNFYSRPHSPRQAMQAMNLPGSFQEVEDNFINEDWSEQVQGAVFDGQFWIFSSNGTQQVEILEGVDIKKIPFIGGGGKPRALYFFSAGTKFTDEKIISTIHLDEFVGRELYHVGQLYLKDEFLYVSHFNKEESHVIVLKKNNQFLEAYTAWADRDTDLFHSDPFNFDKKDDPLEDTLNKCPYEFFKLIKIAHPGSSDEDLKKIIEFQAINPWDNKFYTAYGSGPIHESFIHEQDGTYTGNTLKFEFPLLTVQGAWFSPNGHLYVACDSKISGDENFKPIFGFSALNGFNFTTIRVLAKEERQELEGVCFAQMQWPDGRKAQIHVVLLDNQIDETDNVFFKSFSAFQPDFV